VVISFILKKLKEISDKHAFMGGRRQRNDNGAANRGANQ
jgi:hypothetical protein